MNGYPIKTCEYCKKEGKAYTFMTGETICDKCLISMPTSTYGLRMDLYKSRSRVRELEAERDRLKSELGRCREMYLRDADTGEYYSLDEILKLNAEVARLTKLVQEHQTYSPKQSAKEAGHE